MDRREFLKATFAASAATVALAEMPAPRLFAAEAHQIDLEALKRLSPGQLLGYTSNGSAPPMVERIGTTELAPIAQHLLQEIASRLDRECWTTTLAEHDMAVWASHGRHDGHRIGETVAAYEPGVERFQGPGSVTLTDQVSALWVVPSRFTGGRREFYEVHTDMLRNGPAVEVLPVALDQLRPVVDSLVATILQRRVNVFSAGLYMPQMDGAIEGAYGIASRTYGLALRLVRCCGPNHEVVMRADLLGGTFPTESVVVGNLMGKDYPIRIQG